jgi:hypothetical protein
MILKNNKFIPSFELFLTINTKFPLKIMKSDLSLSETEQKFFDYCLGKIDASIAKKSNNAEILFRESESMRILFQTKGGIDKVYGVVQAHYFNNFEISASFEGFNSGSSVFIQYKEPNEDIDKSDEDFQHNYNLLLNFYMSHLDDAHSHQHPKLKPMIGKYWFYMYLDLKQELDKVGFTLILDRYNNYTPQKIKN